MSRFVPVCPRLSSFVLLGARNGDKSGQKRTNGDKTGHFGTNWETPPFSIYPHLAPLKKFLGASLLLCLLSFTVFQNLGGHASARRVSHEPCFRQAHCFVQGPLRFLPLAPSSTCACSHIGGFLIVVLLMNRHTTERLSGNRGCRHTHTHTHSVAPLFRGFWVTPPPYIRTPPPYIRSPKRTPKPKNRTNRAKECSELSAPKSHNRTIASDFRVDGAKSPEIPHKGGVLGSDPDLLFLAFLISLFFLLVKHSLLF